MIETWCAMLSDLDIGLVATATADLCSASDWPPSIAQIRLRAAEIGNGVDVSVGALEAWERACALAQGQSINLSEAESRSLRVIGGVFAIKNSHAPHRDRDAFVRHYEEIQRSVARRGAILPGVQRVADSHKIPVDRQLPENGPVDDSFEDRTTWSETQKEEYSATISELIRSKCQW